LGGKEDSICNCNKLKKKTDSKTSMSVSTLRGTDKNKVSMTEKGQYDGRTPFKAFQREIVLALGAKGLKGALKTPEEHVSGWFMRVM